MHLVTIFLYCVLTKTARMTECPSSEVICCLPARPGQFRYPSPAPISINTADWSHRPCPSLFQSPILLDVLYKYQNTSKVLTTIYPCIHSYIHAMNPPFHWLKNIGTVVFPCYLFCFFSSIIIIFFFFYIFFC